MSRPAAHWTRLFSLNADLLLNTLEGVGAEQASTSLVAGGNTIAFLVAHLVDSRHFLAGLLGSPIPNPIAQSLSGARSLAEVRGLPELPALRAAWVSVSRHLEQTLERCERVQLDAACTARFPGGDGTLDGAIGFLLQHDSYHLGQIALLRRQLGLAGMSYDRGAMEREGNVEERVGR